MSLNNTTVVETAFELLREAGLVGMSMRTLASRLHVQPSALYWHFPSKQMLLAAVAERILADVGPATPEAGAADEVARVARGLRAAVAAVPDGAEIVALGLAAGARNPVGDAIAAVCARNGAENRADGLTTAITAFVLGLTLEEQTRRNLVAADPSMSEVDYTPRFEAGLDALVAGV